MVAGKVVGRVVDRAVGKAAGIHMLLVEVDYILVEEEHTPAVGTRPVEGGHIAD